MAERLRRVAEVLGTQALAARYAGVSLSQMQNYVGARSEPSVEVLARLAASSGFNLEWLLSGDGDDRWGDPLPLTNNASLERIHWALGGSPTAMRMMYPNNPEEGAESHRNLGKAADTIKRTLTTALASGGREEVALTAQLITLAPRVTKSVELAGLRFFSEQHESNFTEDIMSLVVRVARRFPNDDKWPTIMAFVLAEITNAICNVFDLIEGFTPDKNWLPASGKDLEDSARIALWLEVREVVFHHLKFLDHYELPGKQALKTARRRAPKPHTK